MWPFSSAAKLARRKFKDATYAQAEREMANDRMPPGIRARAYAEAQGDEQKARALSVRLRAEDIGLEAEVQGEAQSLREMEERRSATAAKGEAEAKAQQSPKNSALTGVVIVGALIVWAYFQFFPSTNGGRTEQPQLINPPISTVATPLQESMSTYVRKAARLTPYVLRGEQQVTAVAQSGLQLIHQVRMSKSRASDLKGTDFLRKTSQALAKQNCKVADIRWALGQGAVFRYEITSADGVAVGAVDISKSSCGA